MLEPLQVISLQSSTTKLGYAGYTGDLPSSDGFASPDAGSREGTAAKKL